MCFKRSRGYHVAEVMAMGQNAVEHRVAATMRYV